MATIDKTPYEILGVPQNIKYTTLRSIFRAKIDEHLQNKISAIVFRSMCRAYETLSDFDKRKRYDEKKEWISELPIDQYTPQQLAAEPDLIRDLKKRLARATLTEINAQDPITSHTTLYTAARAGNVAAVRFLTEHGGEPDLSQRTKSTALHVASFYGHADVVRCLLESGADYRIVNDANHIPEQEAYNNDVKKVFAELKENPYVRVAANELEWFRKNHLKQHVDTEYFTHRQTLLHCACKKGYVDLVRWLVETKLANIDLVDHNENSSLHLAAHGGHLDIVNYLLNRGCDSTLRNRWGTTAEEEGTKHGQSLSDLFQSMRDRDMFEMAREGVHWWFQYYFNGQSTDIMDSNGVSLLYYACRYGRYSVAKWLLENKANVNIQMTKNPRSTPLHGAKYHGHVEIVQLLLEYRADVNVKNDFGDTVFDEGASITVNNEQLNKIKQLLQQYQGYLRSQKLIDVEIYLHASENEQPIERLQIDHKSTYEDLVKALPENLRSKQHHLTIAGRPLDFQEKETRIMSAVYCARYTSSKLVDTPLRLALHQTSLDVTRLSVARPDSEVVARQIATTLGDDGEYSSFELKFPFSNKLTFNSGDLAFTFSKNCIEDNVTFTVTGINPFDRQKQSLPNALCFFKTTIFSSKKANALVMLPHVSINHQPNARLYTLATPSTYWYSSDTRSNQLPLLGGIHAFIHHVEIIPNYLTLPSDVFIAFAVGQPLIPRNYPVPCAYLTLHEQDTQRFPLKAYHGTNINVIRSILLDGLVVPGTVVSSGKRISIPSNHIARNQIVAGVPDFATAIFLSPSVHYSSHPAYAISYIQGDQKVIPVLECSVKKNSYRASKCTTPGYEAHSSDNLGTIEWRITDPTAVEINGILFITKINSIATATRTRTTAIA